MFDEQSKAELENVEEQLANKLAEKNRRKINQEIAGLECEEGGVNSGKLWQLRKKLSPKCRDPPTAMMDKEGNLATSVDKIEALALETYQERLENRPIKANLSHIKEKKEELCRNRLKIAKNCKTERWTI